MSLVRKKKGEWTESRSRSGFRGMSVSAANTIFSRSRKKLVFSYFLEGFVRGDTLPLPSRRVGRLQPDKTFSFVPTLRRLAFFFVKDLLITLIPSGIVIIGIPYGHGFLYGGKTPTPPPTNVVKLGYLFLSRSLSQKSIDFSYQ